MLQSQGLGDDIRGRPRDQILVISFHQVVPLIEVFLESYIYIKHTVKTLKQLGAARWHHQITSYRTITVRTEHWVARNSV